jgi:trans-aconitate methyltransferase
MQARSRVSNAQLLASIDFSRFKRILDVGGGNGENILALVKRYPSVQGTLFDFPPVAEMAAKHFAEEGMDARLTAREGNIFKDDFPAGHDCVLFCHFTPIFSEATNRSLIQRAHAALQPGGMVCVYAPFMDDSETGPLLSAFSSPYFLCTVNGQGRHYSWRETSAWLEEAGFNHVTRVRLTLDEGAVLGFKA